VTATAFTRSLASRVTKWWWPATGAVVSIAWVGVAWADTERYPPLAAAAAAGTALLAAAPTPADAEGPSLASVLALLFLPATVAEAARGGNAAPLGVGLCAVALLAVVERFRDRDWSLYPPAVALGVVAVVLGITADSLEAARVHFTVTEKPAAALVLAGAALVLAAADGRSRAERAVVAPVLLAAVLAAPVLPPIALIAGWGALAVGAALADRSPVAIAALAIIGVAAGVPPLGVLFAAGAVLATALDSPIAALCALPGAVVLADVLAAQPVTAVAVAAGAALAATALALAVRFHGGLRVEGARPVAAGLAGWLVIAPGSWRFAGVEGLRAYDVGAGRAAAVGALIALLLLFRRGAELGSPQPAPSDEEVATVGPRVGAALLVVAGLATLASAGWLVVSVVRLH
jgi:hypothetical protein